MKKIVIFFGWVTLIRVIPGLSLFSTISNVEWRRIDVDILDWDPTNCTIKVPR